MEKPVKREQGHSECHSGCAGDAGEGACAAAVRSSASAQHAAAVALDTPRTSPGS
jgi:hypothetical protein